MNAYGNYYDTTAETLVECCEKYYEKTTFDAAFDTQWLPAGTVTALPSATATVSEAGTIAVNNRSEANILKLKFVKKSGLVTGSAKVSFGGRPVNCKIAGVLLVGWADCGCGISTAATVERPVFSGALYFKDGTTMNGFTVELR